jgi:hypothetical protein
MINDGQARSRIVAMKRRQLAETGCFEELATCKLTRRAQAARVCGAWIHCAKRQAWLVPAIKHSGLTHPFRDLHLESWRIRAFQAVVAVN